MVSGGKSQTAKLCREHFLKLSEFSMVFRMNLTVERYEGEECECMVPKFPEIPPTKTPEGMQKISLDELIKKLKG